MIKKWKEFIFEGIKHKFGCVMVKVPIKNWENTTKMIDKSDIYIDKSDPSYGIETDPHVTLLFGLKDGVSLDNVKEKLKKYPPVEIIIDGVDIFENDQFDVVKFNVKKTKQLESMFQSLSELPNENEFQEYKPHITICYVNKGSGKKYIKKVNKNLGHLDTIELSHPSGEKDIFKLV